MRAVRDGDPEDEEPAPPSEVPPPSEPLAHGELDSIAAVADGGAGDADGVDGAVPRPQRGGAAGELTAEEESLSRDELAERLRCERMRVQSLEALFSNYQAECCLLYTSPSPRD